MSKTASKTKYSEIEDIKDDLNSLKSNIVELTKTVKHDTDAQAHDMKDAAQKRLNNLRTHSQQQIKGVERHIKAKPAQSLAIAFVTGMALSAFLKRR